MSDDQPKFGEPQYHRNFVKSWASEAALGPEEIPHYARIGDRPAHPTILLDELGEVELHYSTGWKQYFDADERAAIERFIEYVRDMTPVDDGVWDDAPLDGDLWSGVRQEARKLIVAMGGLSQDLPGNWVDE